MHQRPSSIEIAARLIAAAVLFATSTDVKNVIGAEPHDRPAKDEPPQLLLIRSKGKYGLIDRVGNIITPPKFDSLVGYDSSRRWHSGDLLNIDYSEGLRPGSLDHRWGYFDKKSNEIIPPQFSMAGPFRNGRAQVCVGDDWGMIGRDGKFVIKPQYSFIGPFRNGLARVAKGGIPLEGGLPRSKWGFVNENGDEIILVKYDYAHSFLNGRALVNIGGLWRGMSGLSFQGGRWGVIDESGKFVVEPKIETDSHTPLHEADTVPHADLSPVKYDGKFGYRDSRWNFVIEPQFDEAMHLASSWQS